MVTQKVPLLKISSMVIVLRAREPQCYLTTSFHKTRESKPFLQRQKCSSTDHSGRGGQNNPKHLRA